MNNMPVGTVLEDTAGLKIVTNTGLQSIMSVAQPLTTSAVSTIAAQRPTADAILDRFAMNEICVEHRVQEQELIKLKEVSPDYADTIKENMAKNCAREVVKKMSFTKKQEMDTFTHSFRGRVWVFNKDELKQLIEDIRNGF